jgi:spermidine synthase
MALGGAGFAGATAEGPGPVRPAEVVLLAAVFVVAACGLIYELTASALASYLLGDSVLQFSTVIGVYLSAMGAGSWLSRFVDRQLAANFLRIELLVGVLGGTLPGLLFTVHALSPQPFRVLLYGLVWLVGVLVGIEIPLVMRILKRSFSARYALKDLVSQVLTFDYLGALLVSVAFPIVFVPMLGLVRTGLAFGLLNVVVAGAVLVTFRAELRAWNLHAVSCAAAFLLMLAGFLGADRLTTWAEDAFYADHIVFRHQSPYQTVVVTHSSAATRLFLNGNLQFSSRDEYRYHEALVHPAMAAHGAPRRVLILGGGDGMAAREVLRYSSVESVTLVDLDAAVTHLFSTEPLLTRLNGDSLNSPRLRVINRDAFSWLDANPGAFDVVIVDFPDPSNFALGKLYTLSFYQLLDAHLAAAGYAVVQTTSPLVARRSFWTVVATIEAAGLSTWPYHADVPSFGEWGFVLAGHRPFSPSTPPRELVAGLRFLTPATLAAAFDFPADMARVEMPVNRLSNQVLVRTFEEEWAHEPPAH